MEWFEENEFKMLLGVLASSIIYGCEMEMLIIFDSSYGTFISRGIG